MIGINEMVRTCFPHALTFVSIQIQSWSNVNGVQSSPVFDVVLYCPSNAITLTSMPSLIHSSRRSCIIPRTLSMCRLKPERWYTMGRAWGIPDRCTLSMSLIIDTKTFLLLSCCAYKPPPRFRWALSPVRSRILCQWLASPLFPYFHVFFFQPV